MRLQLPLYTIVCDAHDGSRVELWTWDGIREVGVELAIKHAKKAGLTLKGYKNFRAELSLEPRTVEGELIAF